MMNVATANHAARIVERRVPMSWSSPYRLCPVSSRFRALRKNLTAPLVLLGFDEDAVPG
jgi:hypothetical protein